MKLSMLCEWIGTKVRDRIDMKNGTIIDYNLDKEIVIIKFDDGEIRTIPHHRDPNEEQPHGVFYTNRYWTGPIKGNKNET